MNNYYLTEMNTTKLENTLLKFIYKQHLTTPLVNGVTTKVVTMMYNKKIDYYYSDLIATSLDVPIKFVDNIYLYNQSRYYKEPLSKLLSRTEYTGTPEEAKQFEKEITNILETRKRIHTKKHTTYNKRGAKIWR